MAGRRIALLVATDGYVDPGLHQLRVPARGAAQLAQLLKDPAIGRFDFVRELSNRPKEELEEAIEEALSDRSPDDLVLLYLSCHGIRNDADRLFFATMGTQLRRPHTTAIPAAFLHHLLDECEARTKIVLLDCCYSGLFHRGGAPMSAAPVDLEEALAGRGTFIITASTALEYAYEGDQLAFDNSRSASRFTAAVIEGLSTGLADEDRDGIITPENLYTYVHQVVTSQGGPEQTPTKSGQCEGSTPLAYAPRPDATHRGSFGRANEVDELILGSLLPPPVHTPERGFICDAWEGTSRFVIPIGRLEAGAGGDAVHADFSGRDGNAAVIGRVGSGKTTLLRTLVTALALTHTPHEAEFHLLEGAVNRLGVLRDMPHVKTVAAPHEMDAVNGTLSAVWRAVSERRDLFRKYDIDSVEEFRQLRAAEGLRGEAASDVFLVIDGWLDFQWEREGFAAEIHRLANTGLNYGVHLIVSARRWSDLDPGLPGLLGTRIELAMEDPAESQIDPTLAATVGTGWGLCRRRRFRSAVPQVEKSSDPATAKQSLAALALQMRDLWAGAEQSVTAAASPLLTPVSLTHLLELGDDGLPDPRERTFHDHLRVPIGVGTDGRSVLLDLKGGTHGGTGPHGLCVGAVGSGKSELLRTLVLALAVTHSSEAVNFVLLDVQGSFGDLSALPHVSAVITNPESAPAIVDRTRESIAGELLRRQELLRSAGNYPNAHEYEKARAEGASLEPLPSLLIVIDEFSELLTVKPDFMDILVEIGRVGSALGVHMLLASQRLEEGNLRGLDTHLTYRVALRTFTAAESRAALGVPDAYQLPSVPGSGLLRSGAGALVRFRAAYTSAPVGSPGATALTGLLEGRGPAARPVWLPPLGAPPSLDQLLPPPSVHPRRGLMARQAAVPPFNRLTVPLGIVDKPFEARQDPLLQDLSGTSANLLVVGAPRSGKSLLLRTLVTSFALTHTPDEARFYCLDLDRGSLALLAGLPHVGGVAGRHDPELVRRTVAEVSRLLSDRAASSSTRDSYPGSNAPDGGDPWADVFLVVHSWSVLRQEFEQLEPIVTDIAVRGPDYGVHLVVSAVRNSELRPALMDHLPARLELRLTDPYDSAIDRRAADDVPLSSPGRGLTPRKLHFLAALPRIDGSSEFKGLSEATAALVAAVKKAWPGAPAPEVRSLPNLLPADLLPTAPDFSDRAADPGDHDADSGDHGADSSDGGTAIDHRGTTRGITIGDRATDSADRGIAIGIDEANLAPVFVNFDTDPFFLVFGESESGKTSLLRLINDRFARRYPPDRLRILVGDYRRSHLGTLPEEHMIGHAVSAVELTGSLQAVGAVLAERLPGPDVTPQQLRERSWWTGPDVLVVIDDYELVATPSGNPLDELMEYLPVARDVGLRMVIARTTAGAGRSLYEPVLQRLRELAQGVVLSGDRSEGQLLGQVPSSPQPPGRGTLVTRRQPPQLVQLGYLPR
ncbi:type VII secretion protein EccCb [Sphaerisporangium sp. NPDC088356]|uniref:type VII secretion protein EccCb n=1 Tax=Sphaerisporangium sp. NPDC088356 TaxID=3154871 RepID=UPI003440D462